MNELRKKAWTADSSRNWHDAKRLWSRLLEADEDDIEARIGLGKALANLGDLDGQEKTMKPFLTASHPANPHILGAVGDFFFRRKRWLEAFRYFELALELAPNIGWIQQGQLRTAVELNDMMVLRKTLQALNGFDHEISAYRAVWLGRFIQFFDIAQTSNRILKNLFNDSYEDVERNVVGRIFHDNDNVIEIGGGIGAVTVCIANAVGASNVLAVEANRELLPLIEATTAANGFDVAVRHGAVMSKAAKSVETEKVEFMISSDFWASSQIDTGAIIKRISVPIVILEDLIKDRQANSLVIDIEGGEVELLMNVDLSPIEKMIIEIHPDLVGKKACAKLIGKLIEEGFLIDFSEAAYGVLICNVG